MDTDMAERREDKMPQTTKKTGTAASLPKNSVILTEASPFALKEAYKSLRTNILFSLPGKENKIIGVTSADQSEGKTTTAINIAISLSQIDKRVLLVDSDLRLPTVGVKFGVPSVPGLTNLLIGDTTVSNVIKTVNGIDILPSGSIPKDPTGILESKHLASLLTKLKEYYNFIIMDTPPVNRVTDAVILSKLTDGMIIVVKHETSKYPELDNVISSLERANANVIGFVYNFAPVSTKKYYKKGLKYGYGEKR